MEEREKKAGIALVPPKATIAALIDFQEGVLKSIDLEPVWGFEKNLPHLSLLQGSFDRSSDFREILQDLRDWFPLKGVGLDVTFADYVPVGWFFLVTERPNWLRRLHERAVKLSAPHLIPPSRPVKKKIDHYTEAERTNYLRYGYRYIGDCFSPHITLGRVRRIEDVEVGKKCIADLLRWSEVPTRLPISEIAAFEVGENGAFAATLESVPLNV